MLVEVFFSVFIFLKIMTEVYFFGYFVSNSLNKPRSKKSVASGFFFQNFFDGKMFENISPDTVRSGRTCPANLGVRFFLVRKLICPVRSMWMVAPVLYFFFLFLYAHFFFFRKINNFNASFIPGNTS